MVYLKGKFINSKINNYILLFNSMLYLISAKDQKSNMIVLVITTNYKL